MKLPIRQDFAQPLPATSEPRPGDFPLGSVESRAAARAMLDGTAGRECICFPIDEPPNLELKAEIEAARGVFCPLHGNRFTELAPSVYRGPSYIRPAHLQPDSWLAWHSAQYIKAFRASFPPDHWPATEIRELDGSVSFALKDGLEIHRLPPPDLVYDLHTGEPCGRVGRRGRLLPLHPSVTPAPNMKTDVEILDY